MSDKNYTTKPIELPLSSDKEYVLIDADGYKKSMPESSYYMNRFELEKPFKLNVSINGSGRIDDALVIATTDLNEVAFFREVIRKPKTEAERLELEQIAELYKLVTDSEQDPDYAQKTTESYQIACRIHSAGYRK